VVFPSRLPFACSELDLFAVMVLFGEIRFVEICFISTAEFSYFQRPMSRDDHE
jgi:hypothetical protein